MKNRAQLVELMDALEADLPALIEAIEPSRRLQAFADRAVEISQAAGPDDAEYVDRRLKGFIEDYRLDPLGEVPAVTQQGIARQACRN